MVSTGDASISHLSGIKLFLKELILFQYTQSATEKDFITKE